MRLIKELLGWVTLSSFHRAVAGTIMVQGLMTGLSAIISILISRTLGVEGKGIVSWMLAYSWFGAIFVDMGIGQAMRKYIAKNPAETSVCIPLDLLLVGTSLGIFLPLLYFYGLSAPIPQQNSMMFLYAVLLVPCIVLMCHQSDLLVGLGKNLHFNMLFVVEKGLNIALLCGLLIVGWVSPYAVFVISIITVISRLVMGLVYLRPHFHALPSRAALWQVFQGMRKMMFSTYFCNLSMCYTGMLLTLTLGNITSAKELGYFSIAAMMTGFGQLVPTALATYALPHLAREHCRERHLQEKGRILMLALIAMIFVAVPLFFLPETIISLLFGAAFMPSAKCMQIMSIGMIALGIITVCQSVIASQHKEWLLTLSAFSLALSMTVLTFIFRGNLNAITAAYIYTAVYAIGMAVALTLALCTRHGSETPHPQKQLLT